MCVSSSPSHSHYHHPTFCNPTNHYPPGLDRRQRRQWRRALHPSLRPVPRLRKSPPFFPPHSTSTPNLHLNTRIADQEPKKPDLRLRDLPLQRRPQLPRRHDQGAKYPPDAHVPDRRKRAFRLGTWGSFLTLFPLSVFSFLFSPCFNFPFLHYLLGFSHLERVPAVLG